jgi:hypothetical protein
MKQNDTHKAIRETKECTILLSYFPLDVAGVIVAYHYRAEERETRAKLAKDIENIWQHHLWHEEASMEGCTFSEFWRDWSSMWDVHCGAKKRRNYRVVCPTSPEEHDDDGEPLTLNDPPVRLLELGRRDVKTRRWQRWRLAWGFCLWGEFENWVDLKIYNEAVKNFRMERPLILEQNDDDTDEDDE